MGMSMTNSLFFFLVFISSRLNVAGYIIRFFFFNVAKVALLNLVAMSSTWARIIDVMDSEVVSAALYFISMNWLLFPSI